MMKSPYAKLIVVLAVMLLIQPACMSSTPQVIPPTQDVAGTASAIQADASAKLALQGTEQALQMKGTEVALMGTQAALALPAPKEEPPAPIVITTEPVVVEPVVTEPQATPTEGPTDYSEKIKNAKILLYEDTSDLGIGQWVAETLDRMGLKYTDTESYSGNFMQYLDSGTQWDLIIIAAEDHTAIQGEFWDLILEKAYKKTAIIAEVWYLDNLGGGKIRNFTNECGISYQKDWDLAESIYWSKPDHELFNYPNTVLPLLHYNRYWPINAGDRVRVRAGGDAEIVAGITKFSKNDEGLITVCMGGRTVFQTFCNHDFRQDEVKDLWENYITYTLTNHFKALEAE
jgi:hypothetical protein